MKGRAAAKMRRGRERLGRAGHRARTALLPSHELAEQRVIAVLGMHRSGTSSLAGSLQAAGVEFGRVHTKDPFNLKGNRENEEIWTVHDAILAHSGGSWRRPPAVVAWTDRHRADRDAVVRSYRYAKTWGFKDPRTLLLVEFWLEAVPQLEFVGTFRHPALAAESLMRRNGETASHWIDLWTRYNLELLRLHDERPFPVVSFDLAPSDYDAALTRAFSALGLPHPRQTFFEAGLRHEAGPRSADLPEAARELYERLRAIAV